MYLMFKGKLFSSEPAPEEQRGGKQAVAAGSSRHPGSHSSATTALFFPLQATLWFSLLDCPINLEQVHRFKSPCMILFVCLTRGESGIHTCAEDSGISAVQKSRGRCWFRWEPRDLGRLLRAPIAPGGKLPAPCTGDYSCPLLGRERGPRRMRLLSCRRAMLAQRQVGSHGVCFVWAFLSAGSCKHGPLPASSTDHTYPFLSLSWRSSVAPAWALWTRDPVICV